MRLWPTSYSSRKMIQLIITILTGPSYIWIISNVYLLCVNEWAEYSGLKVGSAAETAAAARAGHRSTLPLAAERIPLDFATIISQLDLFLFIFWKKLKTQKRHLKINCTILLYHNNISWALSEKIFENSLTQVSKQSIIHLVALILLKPLWVYSFRII